MLYLAKILTSSLIIVAASELARRNTALGALLLALPLVSILTFTWVWRETQDTQLLAKMSIDTLWFTLPTMPLFVVLAWMMKRGFDFPVALVVSCALTGVLVGLMQAWLIK